MNSTNKLIGNLVSNKDDTILRYALRIPIITTENFFIK